MSRKSVLLLVFVLILLYPIYSVFQLEQTIGDAREAVPAQENLINLQISIWVTWVVTLCLAVYYKWTERNNTFFYLTYGLLVIAFAVFGFYTQSVVNTFDLPSRFEDSHTHGVLAAVQNLVFAAIFTGLVQGAVWWFTRRLHRR